MKILTEAVHLEDDLLPLVAKATLGDRIERALQDHASPFSAMMDRARSEYLAAVSALIFSDLHTTAGIEDAKANQADARRYQDLCRWIADALEEAGAADDALNASAEDDPDIQQLKDDLNGQRSKPAPDA